MRRYLGKEVFQEEDPEGKRLGGGKTTLSSSEAQLGIALMSLLDGSYHPETITGLSLREPWT